MTKKEFDEHVEAQDLGFHRDDLPLSWTIISIVVVGSMLFVAVYLLRQS